MGNDIDSPGEIKIYIGEGENVGNRLKSHALGDKQKEFWEKAMVFTSKDDYITKTKIQYLESELYRLADEAGRVILDNEKRPAKPSLSEVDNAEMKQFLGAINLILSSIGINILESKTVTVKQENVDKQIEIYNYSIKNAKAQMKIEEDKYVVLKGSTAVVTNRQSAGNSIIKMRESLIKNGTLKLNKEKNVYQFVENYIFTSPSYAASAISGGEENGRVRWRYKGKNLKQIEAEELN